MVNYSKSIIYKLCCRNPEIVDIYIGSTTNVTKRKQNHKSNCNNVKCNDYNIYVYRFIRANGGFENWDMVLIEEYKDCSNKLELHKRERYWLEKLQASLNTQIPNRKIKEYREKNKDKIKEKNKEYKEKNKDKILEYYKEYRETNKNKIKEKKKEKNKEWREKNKDKIKEKRKEKVECDVCGKEMRKDSLYRHNKNIHNKNLH